MHVPNYVVVLISLLFNACGVEPTAEIDDYEISELVEITQLDSTFKLDIRYATTNNFIHQKVYTEPRAFLQKPAAEALIQAHEEFKKLGFGIIIFDGYRPWWVTKKFWDETPDSLKNFVADPSNGSRHNRGCAVDLTLYDLKTGNPLPMPSDYDEFNSSAHPNYAGATAEQTRNRDLLIRIMEKNGFLVYEYEWWHFDYKGWEKYQIENVKFEEIPQ